MAGKKPAKRNMSTPAAPVKAIDEGINILYIGAGKGVLIKCPRCGRETSKGIVREYKSTLYCSVSCVRATKREVGE